MIKIKNLLTLVTLIGLSSCATIILGTKQSVGISSSPSNAKIFINKQDVGLTPKTIEVRKSNSKSFKIKIVLDGYQPYETVLTRKTSGWVAGNIVLGGLIGLAIDFATGGAYILSPEQINAELEKSSISGIETEKNGIKFFVTLNPESDWMKVGQLIPNDN